MEEIGYNSCGTGYIGEYRNSPLNARFPGLDPSVSDRVKNQTWAAKSDHIIDVIQKLSSRLTKAASLAQGNKSSVRIEKDEAENEKKEWRQLAPSRDWRLARLFVTTTPETAIHA
ncbi:hypothetical protein AMTR_s00002p00255150 [Amborella trichopoda]|uniref:Uncharacterized protein n=1 Tax=Amborella trichopoda TaxID=13333 RepID=W1P0Z5_AMBTC|nr:hypothetical protein AMTR_s00002p00255150 [Amborella trichopoda]